MIYRLFKISIKVQSKSLEVLLGFVNKFDIATTSKHIIVFLVTSVFIVFFKKYQSTMGKKKYQSAMEWKLETLTHQN